MRLQKIITKMIKGLDKIYVLNHSDFVSRRERIVSKLNKQNIDYQLVQNFHPNEIEYEKELEGWENFEDIDIVHPYGVYRNFSKKISIGSLSLVLKHLWCYKDQISNGYENVLILEDDVQIPKNFKDYLENNMKEYIQLIDSEGVGVLMMGKSHHFISKNSNGKCVRYDKNQKCRCTHAYVLNINTTKIILDRFDIINLPIDFKLNEIMVIEDIKVAWAEPGLIQ